MPLYGWKILKIKQRACEERRRITTWEKMKKELKRKYLPDIYRQYVFLKLINFNQKELSVEEYIAEFNYFMMKCDLIEPEEQTRANFLGCLKHKIGNVV